MLLDRFSSLRPLDRWTAYGFKWRTSTKRLAVLAALVNAAIGIWFAIFQVQGWTMPKALAIALLIPVGITIVICLALVVAEVAHNVGAFLEHRATSALFVLAEPPGFLDYIPDGSKAAERFNEELLKLGEDTEELGAKLAAHTERFERIEASDAVGQQKEANRSARSIERSADYIEKRLELLEACVKDIDRNFRPWVDSQHITSDEEFAVAKAARDSIDGAYQATSESLRGTADYRDTIAALEAQNPARTVRLATHRLGEALSGVVTVLRRFEKSSDNLVRGLDQKLDEWSKRDRAVA